MERDVLVVGESLVDIVNAADGETEGVRRRQRGQRGGGAGPARPAGAVRDQLRRRRPRPPGRRAPRARPACTLACDPARRGPDLDGARPRSGSDGAARLRVRPRVAAQPGRPSDPAPAGGAHLLARRGAEPRRRRRASRCSSGCARWRRSATTSTPGRRSPGTGPDLVDRGRADGRRSPTWSRPPTRTSRRSTRSWTWSRPRGACCPWARRPSWSPGAATGALWVGPDDVVEVDSCKVEVADTIGAGDTFGAALLDALWEAGLLGADRREALRELDARADRGDARPRRPRGRGHGLAARRGPAVPPRAAPEPRPPHRSAGPMAGSRACGSGSTSPTTAPTSTAGPPSRGCGPCRASSRPRSPRRCGCRRSRVVCAGRTDTGVHARGQVIHLDVDEPALAASAGRSEDPPLEALLRRLNGILPPDVRVRRVAAAPDGLRRPLLRAVAPLRLPGRRPTRRRSTR